MKTFQPFFLFAACLGLLSSSCGGDGDEFEAGGSGGSATGGAAGSGGSATGGAGGNAGSSAGGSATGGTGGGSGGTSSTMTPIFRMDCEDSPLECAWGEEPAVNEYQTATHLEDEGPA